MRQAVAALLVLVFTSTGITETCAGWQATPSARKACCAAADHECAGQMAADACCAQTEQSQQQIVKAAKVHIAAPVTVVVAIGSSADADCEARHAAMVAFKRSLQLRLHAPPLFLTTVLRI
jgi:hypothetical protein